MPGRLGVHSFDALWLGHIKMARRKRKSIYYWLMYYLVLISWLTMQSPITFGGWGNPYRLGETTKVFPALITFGESGNPCPLGKNNLSCSQFRKPQCFCGGIILKYSPILQHWQFQVISRYYIPDPIKPNSYNMSTARRWRIHSEHTQLSIYR